MDTTVTSLKSLKKSNWAFLLIQKQNIHSLEGGDMFLVWTTPFQKISNLIE